jgi:hypothetical protein
MKKTSTIFLQIVVVLIGIGVLAFMLWLPQTEGRNVNATQFEIYFTDPFLAYMYLGAIPFFVALYQAFIILGGVGQTGTFSHKVPCGDSESLNTARSLLREPLWQQTPF